jgi:HEAT repeats
MWKTILSFLFGKDDEAKPGGLRLQGWMDAAVRCGLQVVEATSAFSPRLEARVGPVEVRIESFKQIMGEAARIVVMAPVPPDFPQVKIRPEPVRLREIQLGDGHFDETFSIQGPKQLVFALLDGDTRRMLLAVNAAGRLEVAPGKIEAVVSTDEKVREVLPFLLEICKRFTTPIDIKRSLVENVRRDPDGKMRLQNLLLLFRELPEDPATVEALRAIRSDRSPTIRLRAAKEFGAEGRDILQELAQSLEQDFVSAEAVSMLDQELPLERAKALLDRAWKTGRIQTARACLKVLGRNGTASAVDALTEVLSLENVELATSAAQALGATGSPAAEPPLIAALLREQTELQVAAAKALGLVGSVAAVLPLKETDESSWLDLGFRLAARQAIAKIQSRVQGGSPGQLSLAGAEAGQLSLSEDPAGQLSLGGED